VSGEKGRKNIGTVHSRNVQNMWQTATDIRIVSSYGN